MFLPHHTRGIWRWAARTFANRSAAFRSWWPDNIYDVCEVDDRQFAWLLEGLDIHQSRAHKKLKYTTLY